MAQDDGELPGQVAVEGFRTKSAVIGWRGTHLLDPIFLGVEESVCFNSEALCFA